MERKLFKNFHDFPIKNFERIFIRLYVIQKFHVNLQFILSFMKKRDLKILFFGIFGLLIASVFFGCFSYNVSINGNGKVRAQEIAIDDYDKISVSNAFQYEYVHGAETSFLIIETDENLIPYFHCYVKDRTLYIDIKNPETGEMMTNYQMRSSKCLIRTGSPQLVQVTQVGSSEFTVLNELTGNSFELSKTGSGFFCFRKDIQLSTLKLEQVGSGSIIVRGVCRIGNIYVNRTGSGSIEFYNLIQGKTMEVGTAGSGLLLSDWDINVDLFEFNHTGSGNSVFNGIISAEQFNLQQTGSGSVSCNGFLDIGTFNISKAGSGSLSLKKGEVKVSRILSSGSGNITGMGCTFMELSCNLVGSAYVTAAVTNALSYNMSGSGRLTVKGNPQVKSAVVAGSGSFVLVKD